MPRFAVIIAQLLLAVIDGRLLGTGGQWLEAEADLRAG